MNFVKSISGHSSLLDETLSKLLPHLHMTLAVGGTVNTTFVLKVPITTKVVCGTILVAF